MIDFLTLVFNDETEIGLLKLQAISFQYIQPSMRDQIGNIFIFYNDTGIYNETGIEFLKQYYPEELRCKVSIIYRDTIMSPPVKSSWRNQQYFKLYCSRYIESKYYVVLDGKNHFIRDINSDDFFLNGKPKLYLHNPGTMIRYYKGCLSYFSIHDPFHYNYDIEENKAIGDKILLTTTPFIFITQQVSDLINYVEEKESKSFYDFFMKKNSITEFYLYSTYLIFSNNIDQHEMVKQNKFVITIYNNPNLDWNKFDRKKEAIINSNVKVFGLHRAAVKTMDDEYKQNLLLLYANFFDETTGSIIKSIMYS